MTIRTPRLGFVTMKGTTIFIQKSLTGIMGSMTVMARFWTIAIAAVQVVTGITGGLVRCIDGVLGVVAMRPVGSRRCLVSAGTKVT